jgi:uncharacterized membrane protein
MPPATETTKLIKPQPRRPTLTVEIPSQQPRQPTPSPQIDFVTISPPHEIAISLNQDVTPTKSTHTTRSILSSIAKSGARIVLFAATGAAAGAETGALGAAICKIDVSAAAMQGAIGGALLNGSIGLASAIGQLLREKPIIDGSAVISAITSEAITSTLENMTGQALCTAMNCETVTSLHHAAEAGGLGLVFSILGIFLILALMYSCDKNSSSDINRYSPSGGYAGPSVS